MTKTKQPSENVAYDFEFANYLPSGVNIDSATVSISPSGPTLGTKTISGQVVQQFISGGASGTTYKVTCVATAGAWIRELEFSLSVSDT